MIPYVYPSLREQFNSQMAVFELLFITAVLIGGLFIENVSNSGIHFHKKIAHKK